MAVLNAPDAEGYRHFPAPAKLNLTLRILGRRPDGYHDLQTLFQILNYGDELAIAPRPEGIELISAFTEVSAEDNLIVRAARALRSETGVRAGASIRLTKRLPAGGGLGGGSSDAATTLVALNRIWDLNLDVERLAGIGGELGADVPVFVRGRSAWAEGTGERLTPVDLPPRWYLVIFPDTRVNTGQIFADPALTRNDKAIKIRAFLAEGGLESGYNAVTPLVRRHYPEIGRALDWLGQHATAHLTGTGGCIFAAFDNEREARKIAAQCPRHWPNFVASGTNLSPLFSD